LKRISLEQVLSGVKAQIGEASKMDITDGWIVGANRITLDHTGSDYQPSGIVTHCTKGTGY
jgi:hypothetical protein